MGQTCAILLLFRTFRHKQTRQPPDLMADRAARRRSACSAVQRAMAALFGTVTLNLGTVTAFRQLGRRSLRPG
jgi:hypothetical protein